MTLAEYVRESRVDEIDEDDARFAEAEYDVVHEYFDKYGFTREDLEEFHMRGFDDDTLECWKEWKGESD